MAPAKAAAAGLPHGWLRSAFPDMGQSGILAGELLDAIPGWFFSGTGRMAAQAAPMEQDFHQPLWSPGENLTA